jgi:hypothetical protein
MYLEGFHCMGTTETVYRAQEMIEYTVIIHHTHHHSTYSHDLDSMDLLNYCQTDINFSFHSIQWKAKPCSSRAIARRRRRRRSALPSNSAAGEGNCRARTARGVLVSRDCDAPAAAQSAAARRGPPNSAGGGQLQSMDGTLRAHLGRSRPARLVLAATRGARAEPRAGGVPAGRGAAGGSPRG